MVESPLEPSFGLTPFVRGAVADEPDDLSIGIQADEVTEVPRLELVEKETRCFDHGSNGSSRALVASL
jgi:hypothetical protein